MSDSRREIVTSADGTAIAVSITGDGPPLVVCPGSLSTAADWQAVADELAPIATTYAIDRRGHGASGDGAEYALAREQEDLTAVLDHAGPEATLMAHSFGAVVALRLPLTRRPARFAVYEPPLPFAGPVGGPALDDYEAALDAGDPDRALTIGLTHFVRLPDRHIDGYRRTADWAVKAARTPLWTREVRALDALDPDPRPYAAIDVPTLLLTGQASPPWLTDVVAHLHATIPDTRIAHLTAQGHWANSLAPAAVAAELRRFIA
ncbi:alpha/beta hydrolase [Embleya sp. NPDC005575]|uniref:alpha/beta fold hydrolase n=1 Tax=Embleya sp. NPDC005575 TaxID=3156892 RepID=UPI0033B592E1